MDGGKREEEDGRGMEPSQVNTPQAPFDPNI